MRGSIQKRGKSSWRVRAYVGVDDETGTKRTVSRTVRGTKRDAEEVMHRLLLEVGDGRYIASPSLTVGDLLDQWWSVKRPSTRTLRNKTDRDGRRALDSLLGALEGLRVQSITSAVGDLVRTHAPGLVVDDVPADRFVVRCYRIRSDLVHEGRSEECDAALPHLQLLADEIFLRMMRATS